MKRLSLLFNFLILVLTVNMFSQTVRYRDEIFSAYTLTSNIVYGTGSKNILDIYTGTGDVATNRPLIIYIHGGAFKNGDKDPNSGAGGCGYLKYFGYGMAKRGYVVASINYRMAGWTDDRTHYLAMLEALQDAKASIRFFRKNAALYGIDTSHIYVAGQSAGAHVAAQMACLDSTEVIANKDWGSIGWSAIGGSFENPTLGNAGYSSSFHAAFSNWGALVDTNYMQAGGMPIYCVHGTADATVPYMYGTTDSPFDYGSQLIYNRAQNLGIPSGISLYPGKGHSLDSDAASQQDAYVKSAAWLYTILTNTSVPLTLYSPNGGELWQLGSIHPITWLATNITSVNIDYSTDGGSTWTSIVSNTPAGLGLYNWTVPNTMSSTCKVRISNSADATVMAMSEANFTISAVLPPALTLNTPAGAETFTGGFSQNIKWTSTNVAGIKIEFSSDSGTSWSTIASAIAAASGTYVWTVPNIDAANCLIKLSDTSNAALFSINPDFFSITKSNISNMVLLQENFIPPADTSVILNGTNGWAAITGAASGTAISYISDNLSFGPYPQNAGKAIAFTAGGTSKSFKNFTAPTTGSIYLSYLIKIPTAAQAQTNHIVGIGAGDMTVLATYSLKTYCKWNATTLAYNFGVGGSASTYSTTPTSVLPGSVALIILKYDIAAATGDLYVFPDANAYPVTLPVTSEVHLTMSAFVPGCVYFRSQGGSSGTTIGCTVDGIRVSTAWGDIATTVKQNEGSVKNRSFDLKQNYPNPFNPSTKIDYSLAASSQVRLSVFNSLGEEVAVLVNEKQEAGNHHVTFNAQNLVSGVYLYKLTAGNQIISNKMVLLK